jgi:ABC-2 type transport system permease protein
MNGARGQEGGAAGRVQPVRRVLVRLFLRLFLRGRPRSMTEVRGSGVVWRLGGLLLLYGVLGVVALSTWRLGVFERSTSLHAFTLMMVGIMMAGSSGTLLFNVEEADILLHRPVSPKALLAAKVQVMIITGVALAVALNLFGLVLGVVAPGGTWMFVPAHLLALVLQVVFAASLVTLAYGMCLRWFGRERLDNFITGAQVLVAVGAMIGSQLVPRMLVKMDGPAAAEAMRWMLVLPPAWFGAMVAVLTGAAVSSLTIGLACWGLVATAGVGWLALHRLAHAYGDGLLALNEAGAEAVRPAERHGRWTQRLLRLPLVGRWVSDPVERAAFTLTVAGLLRARDVKLRIYPQLAQLCAYPLVFLVAAPGRGGGHGEGAGFGVAFAGAMASTMVFNTLEMLRFSDHWRGADIFRQAPLALPGPLFHGTRKAVLLLLCGPVMLVLTAVVFFWKGWSGGALLLLPGFLAIPFFAMLPAVWHTLVPFSEAPEHAKNMSAGCLRMIVVLVAAVIIGAAAWWADSRGWLGLLLIVEAGLVAVATGALRFGIDSRSWEREAAT